MPARAVLVSAVARVSSNAPALVLRRALGRIVPPPVHARPLVRACGAAFIYAFVAHELKVPASWKAARTSAVVMGHFLEDTPTTVARSPLQITSQATCASEGGSQTALGMMEGETAAPHAPSMVAMQMLPLPKVMVMGSSSS